MNASRRLPPAVSDKIVVDNPGSQPPSRREAPRSHHGQYHDGLEVVPPQPSSRPYHDGLQVVHTIPPLELGDLDPNPNTNQTVDRDRCILHLKLLAALADLRATISSIDGLFGISDSQAEKFNVADEATKHKALVRIREKRWAVYTAKAADRYKDWWTKAVPSAGHPVTLSSMANASYRSIAQAAPFTWTTGVLPPLGKCNSLQNQKYNR